jgi:hypothetical protein
MSNQKAISISVKALSAAVAKAVEQEKNKGLFSQEFTIDHNIIMGRILREQALALKDAEAAAERITRQVGQAQFGAGAEPGAGAVLASHFEPAVLATHGRIICGFIIDRQVVLRE